MGPGPEHTQRGAGPSPYNLEDFPAYREELLKSAQSDEERSQIEQTFDPANADELNELKGPEVPGGLTPIQHAARFHELYPALDRVLAHHEAVEAETAQARAEAGRASAEALANPRSYLTYWAGMVAAAEARGDRQMARVCAQNDYRLREANEQLLADDANLTVAAEWYLRLGSFSRVRGAEEILAYAGRLPLAKEGERRYKFGEAQQLLLAGSMLSEASLLNERSGRGDMAKQQEYEMAARRRFQQIIEAGRGNPDEQAIVRQARVYVSDLDMREAHRVAVAASDGDEALTAQWLRQARAAIDDLSDCIVEARRDLDGANGETDRADYIRGELAERVILMLLREHVVASRTLATSLPYHAFPRQDYPHDLFTPNNLPRASYDVVLRRFQKNAAGETDEIEIPVQAKHHATRHEYQAPVVVLAGTGDQVTELADEVGRRRQVTGPAKQELAVRLQEQALALSRRIFTLLAAQRQAGTNKAAQTGRRR